MTDKDYMKIRRFNELTEEELDMLINIHYNHWVKYNPMMDKNMTVYKFKELYTKDILPFGITLNDKNNDIVGFCVFKLENLKKYPDIFPWLSDVMIFEKYRGLGYGKILLYKGQEILKKLGYSKIYVWTDQAPEFYKKLGFIYMKKIEKNEGGYGDLFYKEL